MFSIICTYISPQFQNGEPIGISAPLPSTRHSPHASCGCSGLGTSRFEIISTPSAFNSLIGSSDTLDQRRHIFISGFVSSAPSAKAFIPAGTP